MKIRKLLSKLSAYILHLYGRSRRTPRKPWTTGENFSDTFRKDIELHARMLKHRNNVVLMSYGGSAVLFIVFAEWMAYYLDMVMHHGFLPLLIRGLFYIATTLALWAFLLRSNRRLVGKLMRENLEHYESILLAYDSALSLKDKYTGGHGRRVAYYATMIAEALGVPPGEVESIRQAALLHDIGKIGIPDKILTKRGKLSTEEISVIQAHPNLGADIVERISGLKEVAPIIRYHHERFDGKGYPARLKGADIPFSARITAVADALDTLTSDRPYRKSLPLAKTLDEIRRCSGTHFDPAIVTIVSEESFVRKLEDVWKQRNEIANSKLKSDYF